MSDFSSFYSDKTSDIDDRWFFFTQIQFDWIINQLKSTYETADSFSVMDLGCGTGRLLSLINASFPNAILHGVDGTPAMVKQSVQILQGKAFVTQADLNDYTLPHHYDVIISTTVLHHLDNPKSHMAMIKNHLTDSGHAYISEFAIGGFKMHLGNLWWKITQSSHKNAWTTRNFQTLLDSEELKIKNFDILKPDNFWRLQIYSLGHQDNKKRP